MDVSELEVEKVYLSVSGGGVSYITDSLICFQPNYGASVSGRQLVDPKTVTLGGLATALNGFFVTFLERCIRENEEFASGQESDCYRENCQMNDKVNITYA